MVNYSRDEDGVMELHQHRDQRRGYRIGLDWEELATMRWNDLWWKCVRGEVR